MSYQIALISTREHCDYIQKMLKDQDLPYTLHFAVFERIRDLPDLFSAIQDRYDAFCTTGIFSRMVILRTHPYCEKPIVSIDESVADFYSVLLKLLYQDRNLDFSRIYFDDSLWMPEGQRLTAMDYLDGSAEYVENNRRKLIESIPLESQMQAEEIITEHAQGLLRDKKLDFVVCRHSQAYQMLREKKIPCVFAYPSLGNIRDSLQRLTEELELQQMDKNLPGVICLSSPILRPAGFEDVTPENTALQSCLLDFNQEYTAGMLIKKSASGFELYTTEHTIRRLTKEFTVCILSKYLMGRLGQRVEVGYGIGSDIVTARSRALTALETSREGSRSFYLEEERGAPQPLEEADTPEADRQDAFLASAAKQSGLSVATLQRIRSAMELLGRSEVTTQELAAVLHVTVANTNRFMNQLQNAGIARVIGEKKAPAQGRPTRIYQIDL